MKKTSLATRMDLFSGPSVHSAFLLSKAAENSCQTRGRGSVHRRSMRSIGARSPAQKARAVYRLPGPEPGAPAPGPSGHRCAGLSPRPDEARAARRGEGSVRRAGPAPRGKGESPGSKACKRPSVMRASSMTCQAPLSLHSAPALLRTARSSRIRLPGAPPKREGGRRIHRGTFK